MTNISNYFLIFFFLLIPKNCHSQEFKYKKIPSQYTKSYFKKNNFQNQAKKYEAKSYKLENSLPANCDKSAKTDYTDIIQSVINKYRVVVFPNFPLLINSKGLSISSDSKLIFKKKSKLILQSNDKANYEILRLHNIRNVVLYFPVIVGDRNIHIGDKGEWGMGISIRGCQDIQVYKPFITNCWGDGIYIGSGSQMNKNILIDNAVLDYNRRNGISIISATGLNIINPLISNTNGTEPMCGIDIEPNSNLDELQNINIINPITFNNSRMGIQFFLYNLYGINNKTISFNVKNHVDDGSRYGLGLSLTRYKIDNSLGKVKGTISITNPIWKDSKKKSFPYYELQDNNIDISLIRPKIINGKKIDKAKILEIKERHKNESYFIFKE